MEVPRVALPVKLDSETRNTLNQLIRSSSTPQSLAMRSRIVLAAADGSSNQQIASVWKFRLSPWEMAPLLFQGWIKGLTVCGAVRAPPSGPPRAISADGNACNKQPSNCYPADTA